MRSLRLSFQTCFTFFFHLSLFLMLLDWACPMPPFFAGIGVYECSLVGAGIAMLGCVIQEKGAFFRRLRRILAASKWLFVLLGLYVAAGAVTVFYGPDPIFGAGRYIVVGQMLIYGLFVLYYLFPENEACDPKTRLRAMAINVSASAAVIAAIALLGYFWLSYTVYYQRIATIRDYNQYATILLFGLICFTFVIAHSRRSAAVRYGCLIPYWLLVSVAVYQAGSRRSDMLLCLLAMVSFVYLLYREVRRYRIGRSRGALAAGVCLLAVCAGLCVSGASLVHAAVGRIGAQRLADAKQQLETVPVEQLDEATYNSLMLAGEQDELSAAVEGVIDGSGFARRRMIWNVAWDTIRRSDFRHMLFGYGASYSWDLYDDTENNPLVAQLRALYPKNRDKVHFLNPHQLFLQDLLEGGVLLFALQISLLIAIAVCLLRLIRHSPATVLAQILMWLVLITTLLISSAKGMVAHKFFWLLVTVLLADRFRLTREQPRKVS